MVPVPPRKKLKTTQLSPDVISGLAGTQHRFGAASPQCFTHCQHPVVTVVIISGGSKEGYHDPFESISVPTHDIISGGQAQCSIFQNQPCLLLNICPGP